MVWEDLKGARLLAEIDRIGVVADSSTVEAFVKAIGAVTDVQVGVFEGDQRDAAAAWLST